MQLSCKATRILLFSFLCFVHKAQAQLQAYSGKQHDNNCKTIYLVNPTDSIYYIAGLNQKDLLDCQTFMGRLQQHTKKFMINVSNNEDDYLLLLPNDTIAYNVLISAADDVYEKMLSLRLKNSAEVIGTNNDKKRNRQIRRLNGRKITLPIIER